MRHRLISQLFSCPHCFMSFIQYRCALARHDYQLYRDQLAYPPQLEPVGPRALELQGGRLPKRHHCHLERATRYCHFQKLSCSLLWHLQMMRGRSVPCPYLLTFPTFYLCCSIWSCQFSGIRNLHSFCRPLQLFQFQCHLLGRPRLNPEKSCRLHLAHGKVHLINRSRPRLTKGQMSLKKMTDLAFVRQSLTTTRSSTKL